jgi:hypothetical protein
MFDKGSVRIQSVVEDLLVRENIMLPARAARFAEKVDRKLRTDNNSWLELYHAASYTREDRGGCGLGSNVPSVVRDLLVEEGIVLYRVAARFSDMVDRRLYGHNPLRLSDGTQFRLSFAVHPKHGEVESFVPAGRGSPVREYGKLNRRAVKARLSR